MMTLTGMTLTVRSAALEGHDLDGLGLDAHHLLALLVLLALLGAAVLEPDFHLAFGESEGLGELSFPPDGDVPGVMELFLQLQTLMVGVYDTIFVLGPGLTYKRKE